MPAEPLPADYQSHQILVLKGPSTWVRYFVWALPAPGQLSVGLYIPKGRHGAAVHQFLLRNNAVLGDALGGLPVLQHKNVQRVFRHVVRRSRTFRESNVRSAVQWCVAGLSRAKKFVEGSKTLGDSKALRAVRDRLVAPTDDPAVLANAVASLLDEGEVERPNGNERPPCRPAPAGERFVRDPKVAAFVLQRAGSCCEGCGNKAPFVQEDGSPSLEVHHLQRLADGGSDTVENTVAVCPNGHRFLHFEATRMSLTAKLQKKFGKKQPPARRSTP